MEQRGDQAPGPGETRRVRVPERAELVFDGKLFKIYRWTETLFDGSTAVFEMAQRPDNVIVLPIERDRILVTRQEQPGVPAPFFDFPGGRVESTESPVAAASREMLEETGFAASRMELLFEFQPSDRVDSLTSVFRALDLEEVSAPTPDAGERVELRWLTLSQVHRLALGNHRLALTPVLLARSVRELATGSFR